jgi:hypothetical protein
MSSGYEKETLEKAVTSPRTPRAALPPEWKGHPILGVMSEFQEDQESFNSGANHSRKVISL